MDIVATSRDWDGVFLTSIQLSIRHLVLAPGYKELRDQDELNARSTPSTSLLVDDLGRSAGLIQIARASSFKMTFTEI